MEKIYQLTRKDLKFLNEDFSKNGTTLEEFKDVCEGMIDDFTGTVDVEELESLYFWERVLEDLNSIENIRLKDKDDKNCFKYLNDLVDEITKEDNYFSEYDRDQDLWTYFDGVEIYKFELDSNNTLIIRLNITLEELKEEVKNQWN
jgi:hypothetical protein